MKTTKASPVSPGDLLILGQYPRFHPRTDWLRRPGSGGSDTATLTLFCLGWLLYCAGVLSCQGMIGGADAWLDSAGRWERVHLVFPRDGAASTRGTVNWPFDGLRATRGARGPPLRSRLSP
jgi:hypothetical protein